MRARQADSTVAADLLNQARKLVQAGSESRHRRHPQRGKLRRGADPAGDRAQHGRPGPARPGAGARSPIGNPAGVGRFAGTGRHSIFPASRIRRRSLPGSIGPSSPRSEPGHEAARRSLRAIRYENLPSLSANGAYVESGRETSTLAGTLQSAALAQRPDSRRLPPTEPLQGAERPRRDPGDPGARSGQ